MADRLLKLIGVLILLASILGGWTLMQWNNFKRQSLVEGTQAVDLILKPGTSLKGLAKQLEQKTLLEHPTFFVWLGRLDGISRQLQAGEYRITPGMTVPELLNNISKGKVLYREITIIEGWTFKQMLSALETNPYVEHTLKGQSIPDIMATLGLQNRKPEGLFFPDTYLFPRGTRDTAILKSAYQAMQKRLDIAWKHRAMGLPYKTPYQALVAASLIEKETALASERELIAGVLVRRLRLKMPLQIDASIIYGLGASYNGDITTKDLRRNTPYNTYIHRGLPPTPIALPSMASIEAALHPAPGKALYFVARGDGSHVFSDTLKSHDKAVDKYILKKNVE